MKITLITVGKIKEKYWRDAISEYEKRLSKFCKLQILEVPDEKTPDHASDSLNQKILEKEGDRIQKLIPKDAYVVAMAIEGEKYDSPSFSKLFSTVSLSGGNHFCFIIGGSLGIYHEIKRDCNKLVSFSDLTFPHQLMRVILLEQIYRAFKIMNNEPYHK